MLRKIKADGTDCHCNSHTYTQPGDVFSIGVILKQVFARNDVYSEYVDIDLKGSTKYSLCVAGVRAAVRTQCTHTSDTVGKWWTPDALTTLVYHTRMILTSKIFGEWQLVALAKLVSHDKIT